MSDLITAEIYLKAMEEVNKWLQEEVHDPLGTGLNEVVLNSLNKQIQPEVERLETMVRWARADSEALNIENKRYREALEEIVEIYAGMEGFIAETAPEGYQQRIIEQMYNAAKAALGGDKDVK